MARKASFQYKETISIHREGFMEGVVKNDSLNKRDLRVLLHLLTHLDSLTFKAINKKNIALDLYMKKGDVEDAIERLQMYDIIECGSTGSVQNGYRLIF